MENYCIDIAKDFKCLADACPSSCCKGWHIPVDEETYARYCTLEGVGGLFYRLGIVGKEPRRIRRIFSFCPFLTCNMLCRHQIKGNLLLMPLVCRNYPRRVIDCTRRKEFTLELSCPEAARLFLENKSCHKFVKTKENYPSGWDLINDEEDYLSYLDSERTRLINYTWEKGEIYEKWEAIFAYIYNVQDLLARDKFNEARVLNITENKEKQGQHALYTNREYAFYSVAVLDEMLIEYIDRSGLVVKAPKFYLLLRRYMKIFSKLNINDANKVFSDGIRKMIKTDPAYEKKYKAYFTYLIQQEFIMAYESYSLIREIMLCILHTELLMLFDFLEFSKRGVQSIRRETEILYLFEQNVRHNPDLTKALYEVIRREML